MYITIIYNGEVIGVFLFIDKHKISEFKHENTKHTKVTNYKHSTLGFHNQHLIGFIMLTIMNKVWDHTSWK